MPAFKIKGHKVLVDKEDGHFIKNRKWAVIKARQLAEKYYVAYNNGVKTYYLHRLIMNAEKGQLVDHINRNTLDLRKKNLRFLTPSLNRINCEVRQNKKSSSFKGVFKRPDGGYYSAIRHNGKRHWIGSFKTERKAANAYNKKKIELYPSI